MVNEIKIENKIGYNNIKLEAVRADQSQPEITTITLPDGSQIKGVGSDIYRTLLNITDKIRREYQLKGLEFLLSQRA